MKIRMTYDNETIKQWQQYREMDISKWEMIVENSEDKIRTQLYWWTLVKHSELENIIKNLKDNKTVWILDTEGRGINLELLEI